MTSPPIYHPVSTQRVSPYFTQICGMGQKPRSGESICVHSGGIQGGYSFLVFSFDHAYGEQGLETGSFTK